MTPSFCKSSWKILVNQIAESLGFSITKYFPREIWCLATWTQKRTMGMTASLSAYLTSSGFMLLHCDHGLHRGAIQTQSGSCIMRISMTFFCPAFESKSKPVRRSIGCPTDNPATAAHWLILADPAKSSRRLIFPFISHCQRTRSNVVCSSKVVRSSIDSPSRLWTV